MNSNIMQTQRVRRVKLWEDSHISSAVTSDAEQLKKMSRMFVFCVCGWCLTGKSLRTLKNNIFWKKVPAIVQIRLFSFKLI